jgi:uncharacterized protein (DUF2237 family)
MHLCTASSGCRKLQKHTDSRVTHHLICIRRWKQAHDAGKAPKVFLEATDAKALDMVPLDLLKQYAVEDV